ncbi:DUF3152 domain-containing protein [Streptomyces sp. NPDC048416]|uniref:DUF3152 domain-containing protein n=1 Tax=Streptomyces sp. NPDC048416 TaxID=3365546 RepID=UPI003717C86D
MGRHSRPKGSGGAEPIPEAPGAPGTGQQEQAGPSGGGRRRRDVPGEGPAQHHGPGTPAFGTAQVRGGHPQHREGERAGGAPDRHGRPYPVQQRPVGGAARIPGPRRSYTDAFDGPGAAGSGPRRTVQVPAPAPLPKDGPPDGPDTLVPGARSEDAKGSGTAGGAGKVSKGRTYTGIAAAAVTTVLAVVVAGQVTSDGGKHDVAHQSASDKARDDDGSASRGGGRSTPQVAPAVATYDQKMAQLFPLDPKLTASGRFEPVPGSDAAPGKGHVYHYRVDVEQGLGLDGALFAEAVQKTLNDDRSWSHAGKMTFARVSTDKPDFVITLASPGTTGTWCAKSGLDTLEDNVSCDSAATNRVMINAYRWARGSVTFGDAAIHAYRQMLINHEVGHRLGHDHESCRTAGTLAPVMQQQTKTLDLNGIKCLANPWVYPEG